MSQSAGVVPVSPPGAGQEPTLPAMPAENRHARFRHERAVRLVLLAGVGVLAVLHLQLVFRINVNWDEFRFLSDVYELRRGTLSRPLQTLHARAFAWLAEVPGFEIEQIIAARGVYFGLLMLSCASVYAIARGFATPLAALFAVLCLLAFSEVVAHGTSFRYDGLAVALLVTALALLVRARHRSGVTVAAGILTATALLVTVKTVFYLPLLVAAVVLCSDRDRVRAVTRYVAVTTAAFMVVYLAHRQGLAAAGGSDALGMLRDAGGKMFGQGRFVPQREYLFRSVLMNPVTWLFMAGGAAIEALRLYRRTEMRQSLLLLTMLIPVSTVAFYRNAFPYYYVFVIPPALVLCAVYFDSIFARSARRRAAGTAFVSLAILGVLGGFAITYARYAGDDISDQRRVLRAVHEMFPQPVPYIDRNSMVASFPKVGFFMSSWGFEDYRAAGVAIFADMLRAAEPKFLLANHSALRLDAPDPGASVHRLLPEDLEVLRANFVRYSGPIYLPGKRMVLARGEEQTVDVLISGAYWLEAAAPVTIDGVQHPPGSRLVVAQGQLRMVTAVDQVVTMLYAAGATGAGHDALPEGALFRGL